MISEIDKCFRNTILFGTCIKAIWFSRFSASLLIIAIESLRKPTNRHEVRTKVQKMEGRHIISFITNIAWSNRQFNNNIRNIVKK